MLRGLLPCLPPSLRRPLWDHLAPHVWWRPFPFQARIHSGIRFEGDTTDPIHRYLYYFGIWEPHLTAWISRRLQPGDCFVDVGANTGYFSLLASRLVGGRGKVVAVEAMPDSYARLQRNLDLNTSANVRAVNLAVAEVECELQFFGPGGLDGGMATAARGWAAEHNFAPIWRVPGRSLPDILSGEELREARLMKIDVEGLELQVLRPLLPHLPRCRPELEIVVEITPAAYRDKDHLPLLGQFQEAGFHLYHLANDYQPRSYLDRPAARPVRLRNLEFAEQRDLILSRVDAQEL